MLSANCQALFCSPPTRGHIHVRTVQRGDGRASQQTEGAFHVSPQDFKRAADASLASGGQAIGISAPTQNGAGSEAEGFDNVGAAANPAVHQDFGLTVHSGYDFGQGSQRSANAVELPSAMVGDDHRGGTFIDCASSVIPGENAFDGDRARPETAIHLRSFQVTAALASAALTSTNSIGPLPGMTTFGNLDRPPSRRKLAIQPGRARICGRNGILSSRPPLISSFMP